MSGKLAAVDEVAVQLFDLVRPPHMRPEPDTWANAEPSVRAFYRKLARWHLGQLQAAAAGATLPGRGPTT